MSGPPGPARPWRPHPLHGTGVAIQFLTRIPVPGLRYADGDLRRALGAFPLVGLLVAGVGVAIRVALGAILPPAPATVAAVAAMVAVTGALHEDGLADAADGLGGGHTPQERLAIMRDSRIGTYGAVALILVLGMEIALLAPLSTSGFARAVAAGAVAGRASSLPLLRWIAPAPDSSASLAGRPSIASLAVGGLTLLATLAVTFRWEAPIPLVVAALIALVCAAVVVRLLGGVNGDVLGATNRLVDVAVIATFVAVSV
jgi:adenosylcobinamide-GDP ribazoletransferase